MKKSMIVWMSFILLLLGVGCSSPAKYEEESAVISNIEVETHVASTETIYPLTITDSLGREVTILEEPKRIVSVGPNITETIYAIGAEDLLIGRTDYCDFPAEVLEVTSVGLLSDPNQEVITALNPDLIIGSTHFKQEVIENLENLGYTVLVLYGKDSFEGVYQTIESLGLVLNVQEESQKVQLEMKEKVATVLQKVEGAKKPSVYYVVAYGERGDFTATGDTFIAEILEMAGGNNIAEDGAGWRFSYERIVESDPEIIICSQYKETKSGFMSTENYQLLTAVQEGHVYEINNNLLDRQGPRLAEGLEEVAKILHPERFE